MTNIGPVEFNNTFGAQIQKRNSVESGEQTSSGKKVMNHFEAKKKLVEHFMKKSPKRRKSKELEGGIFQDVKIGSGRSKGQDALKVE